LYRLGVSLQCAGKWSDADRYLKRCSEKYSKTEYGMAAAKRVGAKMFRIQTGAFSEMDGAMRQTALLKQAGHQADWEIVRQKTGKYYLVRAGRYTGFSEAAAALATLKDKYHDAYIVTAASAGY
jgi:cell division protein FtsN